MPKIGMFLVLTIISIAMICGNASNKQLEQIQQQVSSNRTKSQLKATDTNTEKSNSSETTTASNMINKVNKYDDNQDNEKESDMATTTDDVTLPNVVTPTTYRPLRSTVAPVGLPAAQERDTKLMNVLAARRSALQRGRGVQHTRRSSLGTTRRTPYASQLAIESTSRSPSDPRSNCVLNCTRNFTRRTTATCMRQCANIERMKKNSTGMTNHPPTETSTKITPSMATLFNNSEKDTNEILFTDESSHGLFVVTKELNDTINHIPDMGKVLVSSPVTDKSYKYRTRVKPPISMTFSNEDMEIAPYLYFGQKLPPLRPSNLNITPVSDDVPKLIEVSVAKSKAHSSVERTRSRVKYNPRERNAAAVKRRFRPSSAMRSDIPNLKNASFFEMEGKTKFELNDTTTTTTQQGKIDNKTVHDRSIHKNDLNNTEMKTSLLTTETPPQPSTTLLINVPDEETKYFPSSTASLELSERIEQKKTAPLPQITRKTTEYSVSNITNQSTNFSVSTFSPVKVVSAEITSIIPSIKSSSPTPTLMNSTTTSSPNQTSSTQSVSQILKTTILSSVRSTVHPRTTTEPNLNPNTNEEITTTITNLKNNNSFYFMTTVGLGKPTKSNISPQNFPIPNETDGEEPSTSMITINDREVIIEKPHINPTFYVLGGMGIIPIVLIVAFVIRVVIVKKRNKNNEDFDDYTTDQQPISPVKKLDSKFADEDDDDDDHHHHNNETESDSHRNCDANHNNRYDEQCSVSSDQEFDRRNIRLKSLLGEGNFGQVWKAEADDLRCHLGATRIVAVKTVRACSAQVGLKEEANIMRKLGSHSNVVTLLGACVESEPQMLIMEYAMRGRLLSLLRAARSATNILPASVPGGRSLTPLSPRTLAGFALDISCGMEYIAARRIVHRDLAARNILLDHNGVCKICDFGMSIDLDAEEEVRKKKSREQNATAEILRNNSNKFKFDFGGNFILNHWSHNFSQNQKKSNSHEAVGRRPALPIRWMAPESLQFHIFSTETDVWAFGIVLWEIATLGSTPYANLSGREVVRCVPNGVRPDLPKEGRHEFSNLMSRCWLKEPQLRPSFRAARVEISRFLCKWVDDDSAASDYMDVSGFSEDLEHGVVYFNHRISEFECEI